MTLELLPEASAELYEAAAYYEGKQPGLGWRFRSEVLELCRLVANGSPRPWARAPWLSRFSISTWPSSRGRM